MDLNKILTMEKSIAKTKTLFKKAYNYNWDNGLSGLEKILKDKNCDKATATMIFWHGQPSYYYNNKNSEQLESYEQKAVDFLKAVANNILSNKYPTVISYAVETSFLPKELGNIPKELSHPIIGEIDYTNVLYPNDNPFEEQIISLCKNCTNVKEMYELEKVGANFNLKVNKGYSFPIQIAIGWGQTEALVYFIEQKYDLNKKDGKRPLLFGAVVNRHFSIVQLMVENGVKINQKGEFGRTVLHYIAGYGESKGGFDATMEEIATYLIKNGADMNALDSDKKTPLDLAMMWSNTKYIHFITDIQNKTKV
jgi:Domain of unknown function (DUF4274)/Ankyrin repeats (3 copies)